MTRRTVIATLTVLALVAAGMMSSPATAGPGGRYIVVLKDSTPSAAAVARDHSQRYGARVSHVYEHALKGYAAELSGRAVQGISRDRRVDFVEADQVVEAFEVPTGVDRVEADKKLGFGGETATSTIATPVDVDIAILDTGISAHADLTIAGGWNCAKGGPFNNSCDEGGYDDGNGHGTHVAGSAAAKNALFGVATGARLWAVKVLGNDGSGWISWIVAGACSVWPE